MIKIIDSYIMSKTGIDEECEDGLFISGNFIAVIDGVTSKGKLLWDTQKSGVYVKNIICKALLDLDKDIDARNAIDYINKQITFGYGDRYEISKDSREERLQAGIIIFSNSKKEIWSFGDCKCIVNEELHDYENNIDSLISNIRSLYITSELISGKSVEEIIENDTGREYIMPLLKRQLLFTNSDNKEYGYDVLDGFKINSNNVNILKLDKGDEVVLASDGYPILKNTLDESEEVLKKIIKEDPLFINEFKSTKGIAKNSESFDDRTYIRFIV